MEEYDGESATDKEVVDRLAFFVEAKLKYLHIAVAKRAAVFLVELGVLEKVEFDKDNLCIALSLDKSVRKDMMDIFQRGRDARLITLGSHVMHVDAEAYLNYGQVDRFTKEHLAALKPWKLKP
jgi:hypothetical protein